MCSFLRIWSQKYLMENFICMQRRQLFVMNSWCFTEVTWSCDQAVINIFQISFNWIGCSEPFCLVTLVATDMDFYCFLKAAWYYNNDIFSIININPKLLFLPTLLRNVCEKNASLQTVTAVYRIHVILQLDVMSIL